MASASAAVRGVRGAALVGGKILDDVLIGIDPSGVGKIVSVARARSGSALASRARRVDGLIVPGYVDVHLHGAGGHDVLGPGGAQALLMASRGMKSPERDIVASLRALAVETAKHGYAAILPAAVSLPVESLQLWVRAVGAARAEQREALLRGRARDEAIILGANSEGPAISHARKGAHDPMVLISGAEMLRAMEDRPSDWSPLRLVTVAPELKGGEDLIRALAKRKIVASIGHSTATFEQANAAWAAGATSTTHLCNGMDPFHHRTPGLVGAALAHQRARVELICDGVHVEANVVKILADVLGNRLMVVSDACPVAGLGDGDFKLGSMPARVKGAHATLRDGTLVGAVSLVDVGVQNLITFGVALPAAVTAASKTPADLLRTPELGRIAVGSAARLSVINPVSGALRGRLNF
ncbi:MAG: N-acetylglucosamine-6-phosphate deacetylase [Candidatus Limnocylindrus sp.]